jgi:hypothetical protein
MAEYGLSLPAAFRLSVSAGLCLLEARACRLDPKNAQGWLSRQILRARAAARAALLEAHDILPTPKRPRP